MNEIQRLELLSESIDNEIEELQSLLENSDNVLLKTKKSSFQKKLKNIISNLESANDSIYGVFEELNGEDIEGLQKDYDVIHAVLEEKLSHEEKVDMRIKYNIHFY